MRFPLNGDYLSYTAMAEGEWAVYNKVLYDGENLTEKSINQ